MGVCHSKSEPKGPYNRLGETFKAQVRPIHSGAPVTPVRQGLCVSGGGARAFSWALGVPSTAILVAFGSRESGGNHLKTHRFRSISIQFYAIFHRFSGVVSLLSQ